MADKETIINQLIAFGYDRKVIENAIKTSINQTDINSVMDAVKQSTSQLNVALQHLSVLNKTVDSISVHTGGAHKSIKNLARELKKNQKAEVIGGCVNIAADIVNNVDNLSSGNPIKVASGILNIMGTISSTLGGPYGAAGGALCSVIASILPLFGGGSKQKGIADVIKEVIDQALEDYKDEEVDYKLEVDTARMKQDLIFLGAIATQSKTGGIVQHANEQQVLMDSSFRNHGFDVLGLLRQQIKRYKHTNKDSKAKKVAKYMYYYCMISIMRRAVISLQCSLLEVNGLTDVKNGILAILDRYDDDRDLLDFIYHPTKENRKVYRYIQTAEVLTADQKILLQQYRTIAKCRKMDGFYCEIFNVKLKEHLYAATYGCKDRDRRRVFTWRQGGGRRVDQGGWRILGTKNNCKLYNIYQGEYLYAADYSPYDNYRRSVFTWRPHTTTSQSGWKILTNGAYVQFKNIKQGEYLFAEPDPHFCYDSQRRRVFTWRLKNAVTEGYWELRRQSPIGDL